MTKVRFNRRMPLLQARSRVRPGRLESIGSAFLAIAYILTPHPSHADANPTVPSPDAIAVSCSSAPVTSTKQCHLDMNDRMKIDLGTWGSGVHPSGPNYFCVERQKLLEKDRNRGCR
jgi:hypothetical protein